MTGLWHIEKRGRECFLFSSLFTRLISNLFYLQHDIFAVTLADKTEFSDTADDVLI